MASNSMTRIQTIFCFSVQEPDTALSPLAIHFECVQISVFCYIFVIVDRSKASTWNCLGGKHLTSNALKTWRELAITSAAPGRLFDARLVRPPMQAHTKAVQLAKKGQVKNVLPSCKLNETSMLRLQTVVQRHDWWDRNGRYLRRFALFELHQEEKQCFFLMKLKQSETSKISTIPVSPIMSLFNQFSTRSVSSSKYIVSKEKIPRLGKLSKPPQGASKLAPFDTVLAIRTHAVTFFFLRRTCSCRLSSSLSSHLTPDQLVLHNTVLQPNKKALRQPSGWRGSTAHA